ncbi:hypothetical protein AB1Y20_022891 [Prymnesium parvum]|uniref:DNA replication complex GINS protein PSF3 N-terminal domain-containing protein n=1 Tax=Prymnesium parvum TaxID=97485 RepID=A0AB34JCG5_PRYPA
MDIDEVLMSEQMVPCTTLHDAQHLAWLDQTARQSQPLAADSRLSLPLWMAEPLHKRQNVEVELPEFYNDMYRQALRADAPHLDLRSQSDYYFDVGSQLSILLDGTRDLADHLLAGFASRYHGLLPAALNASTNADSSAIEEKLTLRERAISFFGRSAARDYSKWRAEKQRLEQSTLIRKKRHRNPIAHAR